MLKRLIKLLDRSYIDQTYALSNTQSTLFLDYKGRKHLYMFSSVALTLNLYDIGTLAVPANTWTDISFKETIQVFTTNQSALVLVFVRATDDLIITSTPPPAVQTVAMNTSAVATITSVAGAAADTGLLATNTGRKGAYFYNDSTAILYLELGSAAASTTNYTVQIPAQGFYEIPVYPVYTGAVRGIWSAANGAVRITEMS